MEIKGKVYCFFEQSGTFKNEFIKLGIPAEDYDIQNHFGQTDHVIDLFAEIEKAYDEQPSVFDDITPEDLIMAFFPCIYFCDAKTMQFRGVHIGQRTWSLKHIMDDNIRIAQEREQYFIKLLQLVAVTSSRQLRMIIENPWNDSRATYLQNNFIPPALIDTNRALRGDYYVKPTAYWYINAEPTQGITIERNAHPLIVYKQSAEGGAKRGVCDEMRSLISPTYARNFICDFVIGKVQKHTQLNLFEQ